LAEILIRFFLGHDHVPTQGKHLCRGIDPETLALSSLPAHVLLFSPSSHHHELSPIHGRHQPRADASSPVADLAGSGLDKPSHRQIRPSLHPALLFPKKFLSILFV
jgi:hypothetical protein